MKKLLEAWPVIIALAVSLMAFAKSETRIDYLEKNQVELKSDVQGGMQDLKDEVRTLRDDVSELKKSSARIEGALGVRRR